MKVAYARKYEENLPTYSATEDGPDLIIGAGRVDNPRFRDANGNLLDSEVIHIDAPQAVHDIITEWAGYEYVATKEDLDA